MSNEPFAAKIVREFNLKDIDRHYRQDLNASNFNKELYF